MFTADDIQARLRETPFVPVRLLTSSGQSYDITHPDLVLVSKRFLIIGKPSNDNPMQIEAASRVAVLHVTDMQDIPHAKPTGSNGEAATSAG
jgi:hypothetical protein